ncbi:MAG: hypothetical protein ABSH49_10875 [Bryobacteraceae bacterium]
MKAPLSLEQAEDRLRTAAARGDFATAETAARDYVHAVELAAGSLPHAVAASLIRQAMAAVETARRQLCVARTRLAGKLRAVERRMRYVQTGADAHTWRIEA